MEFVIDPPIAEKIARMKQRVLWQEPPIVARGIDQTALVLDDGHPEAGAFSFLVLGDSGAGPYHGHNPQRQVAERLLLERPECRFVLHTGDVMYLVGSDEYYPKNFIEPYRELLVGGEKPERLRYDRLVFNLPFLPVPGNHDYYDVPFVYGLVAQAVQPLQKLLGLKLDLDVGWRGSRQGKVYARAFLDYLKDCDTDADLARRLDAHYTALSPAGDRCLRYRPGELTRLPNRYYSFRSAGIDFFALDSNTFLAPPPLPESETGRDYRKDLERRRSELDQKRTKLLERSAALSKGKEGDDEELEEMRSRLEQLEEVRLDMDKQLASDETTVTDLEQLDWLQARLVASWQDPAVRGRVIFLHHPPYVTEATKWHQAQTLAVRLRLRRVFDAVRRTLAAPPTNRPLVDLMLTGHAHCLEHLRVLDTGHADAGMDVVICGGSGFSLRAQRREGPLLFEERGGKQLPVARSRLFLGREGEGQKRRRPYSFVRVDVSGEERARFVVRPFAVECCDGRWSSTALAPFTLGEPVGITH